MNNPLVSIIIPTYNRAHYIGETLESVIAQTYQNWECIVIDDGSNDYTAELMGFYCKNDHRVQYHHRPSNKPKGANACRNYGIEFSKGNYLTFLDSDDLLHTIAIQTRVDIAIANLTKSFLIFKMTVFYKVPGDTNRIVNKYIEEGSSDSYLLMFLRHDIPWPITSLFIKKETLSMKFDEGLKRLQDVEFSSRLLLCSEKEDFLVIDNISPDCFYRNDERHSNYSISFLKVVANSLIRFYHNLIPIVEKEENKKKYLCRDALKKTFCHFYKNHFLPSGCINLQEVKELKTFLFHKRFITKRDQIKFRFLEILYFFSLQKIKGLGVYRLTRNWLK
ncbi:glycosyltransferase family 2 protein [Zunongwangia sp. SCSIO 43204]|uniref:glycosyltransferase family 2 protein n=1 Tax=Zunongwangia sp. SCSIO 43204 TaxID=2779359 RepID=UPI001CA9EB0E|nr:glycosyltransferase family 2 protein [Zunongwangia sp. SCSIO 43204]UAB86166.1 glycosyltransferase family 2 protein [Zunongwangia sp. SCSIO 43204]